MQNSNFYGLIIVLVFSAGVIAGSSKSYDLNDLSDYASIFSAFLALIALISAFITVDSWKKSLQLEILLETKQLCELTQRRLAELVVVIETHENHELILQFNREAKSLVESLLLNRYLKTCKKTEITNEFPEHLLNTIHILNSVFSDLHKFSTKQMDCKSLIIKIPNIEKSIKHISLFSNELSERLGEFYVHE